MAYVPPRDGYEFQLAMSATSVLNAIDVGVLDDLVDLGMGPDEAVVIARHASERLRRVLSDTELLEARTVEAIADKCRQREPSGRSSSLVPVHVVEGGLPLVLVHPLGGNGFWYLPLARKIGRDRPLYALQSHALDLSEPLPTGMTELAASYVEDLLRDGPPMPCALAGWSFGGIVAYEVARQLREAGMEVPVLAMLDSGPADVPAIPATPEAALHLLIHAVRLDDLAAEIACLPDDLRLHEILVQATARHMVPPGFDEADIARMLAINEAHLRALRDYAFGPYGGDMVVFRSADRVTPAGTKPSDDSLGWNAFVEGEMSVQPMPGNHFDALSRTNLPIIAKRLTAELDRAHRDTCRSIG